MALVPKPLTAAVVGAGGARRQSDVLVLARSTVGLVGADLSFRGALIPPAANRGDRGTIAAALLRSRGLHGHRHREREAALVMVAAPQSTITQSCIGARTGYSHATYALDQHD